MHVIEAITWTWGALSVCGTPVAVFHEALRPDTVSASMQCMQLYKQSHVHVTTTD